MDAKNDERIGKRVVKHDKSMFVPVRVASISRVSQKPVFIDLNYRCGLHLKLTTVVCYKPPSWEKKSNNTSQGSAVTTILSKPRMLFHVCEGDFGI